MNNKQPQQQSSFQSHDEDILVVSRNTLFKQTPAWNGVKKEVFDTFVDNIEQHATFISRASAETDESYKQVIPYLLFKFENKYFVMQRKSTASEQRLASKYSLGIGGHIRQEDITNKSIFDWAQREFEEEVNYTGSLQISKFGVLNDDSNAVGRVHLGMVILLEGESDQISIKDEHKSGTMLTLEECKKLHSSMETWSQLILNEL